MNFMEPLKSDRISAKTQRPSPNAFPQSDWNYEATVTDVEEIIAQIELGELDLAAVFDQFALATAHLQQCETFLTQRQQQMDLLVETLDDPEF